MILWGTNSSSTEVDASSGARNVLMKGTIRHQRIYGAQTTKLLNSGSVCCVEISKQLIESPGNAVSLLTASYVATILGFHRGERQATVQAVIFARVVAQSLERRIEVGPL